MADVSKIKLPNGTTYDIKDSGALPLTGGTITGSVIFQDTTSMDEATIGDLVVNGNASFTNNIQANTINGVTVGSNPKFTDTITTSTTTGSGNAVTAITASNGALTVTKGTTFLTSHQDISGKADKATTLAGYGITDAKISNGTITLGSNTITPLTSYVQSNWNQSDSTADDYIKNKPIIPTQNIWYATCSTAADTSAKVATTDSQDFVLETGNMVRVKFDNGNISSATATLNVDGTGAKSICTRAWDFVSQYYWRSDEIVDFVYDGTNFVMSNTSAATTVFYGVTKLSSSTSSTSEVLAATPKAVKAAYDLANDATATPTASKKSKFDSDAHMNSTDMTTQDVSDFVDGLNVSGGGVVKTNVTPTSGTNYSGYGNCYYEVLGKLVHFHIGIGGLTANTTTKIYTMPSGLRPQTKIFAKGSGGSSLNYSGIELWENGEIYVTSQGTYCGAELWYFV